MSNGWELSHNRLLKNAICFHAFGVTSSFVIAAYCMYASFLRIRAPCISSFLTSLLEMRLFSGLINPFKGPISRAVITSNNPCCQAQSPHGKDPTSRRPWCMFRFPGVFRFRSVDRHDRAASLQPPPRTIRVVPAATIGLFRSCFA